MKKSVISITAIVVAVLFLAVSFITLEDSTINTANTPIEKKYAKFRVAFIGDQGHTVNSFSVLNLIKNEGAEIVLHQGDLDYSNDPDKWDRMITNVLGDDFPYFASMGEHDGTSWYEGPIWDGYRDKLYDRLKKNPEITCIGELGVKSACTYKDLFFIQVNPGLNLDELHGMLFYPEYDSFIENQLKNNNSVWSVCSWAKNMNTVQLGTKDDTTGWGVYNTCKNGGAIIATGHEHSYHRTKTLIDIENQRVDPEWSDPHELRVKEGSTFVFVSGLGGHSVRNQDRCLPTTYPYGCNQEWANIYTTDQDANFGALFCDFNMDGNPNKASCYFKNIDGEIIDEFNITSFIESGTVNTSLSEVDSLTDYLSKTKPREVDLMKTNLSGMNLSNHDLSNVDLFGKDLTYANLSGQNLSKHDLTDTILQGADLTNSILPDSGLSSKDYTSTIFDGVDLSGKDLSYSKFDYASFDNTNMENTNLMFTEFFSVDLTKIKNKSLAHSDLTNAAFPYSNFSGIDLTDTVFRNNNFTFTTLSDLDFTVIFEKSIFGTVFESATISNTTFDGVNFYERNFYEWSHSNKAHMNQEMEIGMNNKFVVESEFINKFIINNRIEGNDLVLTFVYLNNFYNANLENVIFSNAIMKHTNFKDVTLKNVNFSNTELTGSNFDDTALTNTSLDNAIINSPKELTDYWNWWLNLTPEEKELIQK